MVESSVPQTKAGSAEGVKGGRLGSNCRGVRAEPPCWGERGSEGSESEGAAPGDVLQLQGGAEAGMVSVTGAASDWLVDMRRSWEAVVEGTLKRITASSPFEEKGREKIGAENAAAGFEICRWEMEAGAGLEADCGDGAGKAGLEDEENELKFWSMSWVLAGSGAGWRQGARNHYDFHIGRVFLGDSLCRWCLPLYRHSMRITLDVTLHHYA